MYIIINNNYQLRAVSHKQQGTQRAPTAKTVSIYISRHKILFFPVPVQN